ncbi:hypothetical protein V5O48_000565 [Marasmius crinis-equi]|uniref:Uncharacterized protein n=1 Tax=Marasmius crinis-equi TaxID=585013 RepID=A0ABR3G0Z8_9AGAR
MPSTPRERYWLQEVLQELEATLSDKERVRDLGLESRISSEGPVSIIREIADKYLRPKVAARTYQHPPAVVKEALRLFAAEKSHSTYPFSDDDTDTSSDTSNDDPGSFIHIIGSLEELIEGARRGHALNAIDATRCIHLLEQHKGALTRWNNKLDEREEALDNLQEELKAEKIKLEGARKSASDAEQAKSRALARRQVETKEESSRLEMLAQTLRERQAALEKQQQELTATRSKQEAARLRQEDALSQRESVFRCQEAKLAIDKSQFERSSTEREEELKKRESDLAQKAEEMKKRESDLTEKETGLQSRKAESIHSKSTSPRPLLPADHWAVKLMGVDQDLRNLRDRETKAFEREKDVDKKKVEMNQKELRLAQKESEIMQRDCELVQKEQDLQQRLDVQRRTEADCRQKATSLGQLKESLQADSKEITRRWNELHERESITKDVHAQLELLQGNLSRLEAEAVVRDETLATRESTVRTQELSLEQHQQEQEALFRQRMNDLANTDASRRSKHAAMLYEMDVHQTALEGKERALVETETHLEERELMVQAKLQETQNLLQQIPSVQMQMQKERILLEEKGKALTILEQQLSSRQVRLQTLEVESTTQLASLESSRAYLEELAADMTNRQSELEIREAHISSVEASLNRITQNHNPSPSRVGSNMFNPFTTPTLRASFVPSPNNPFVYPSPSSGTDEVPRASFGLSPNNPFVYNPSPSFAVDELAQGCEVETVSFDEDDYLTDEPQVNLSAASGRGPLIV